MVGVYAQTVVGADGTALLGDGEDVENLVAAELVRGGEDLEGTGEIEDLNAVEEENGDVLFHGAKVVREKEKD